MAKTPIHLLLPVLMVSAALTVLNGAPAVVGTDEPTRGVLQVIRSFATAPHGVPRPSAMTWSDQLGGLVLAGTRGDRTVVRGVLADETTIGGATLDGTGPVASLSENPSTGTVTALTASGARSIPAPDLVSGGPVAPGPLGAVLPAAAVGAAYDSVGRLYVLADGEVQVAGGPSFALPPRLADHDLRGLAAGDPGELLTYDATDDALLVLRDRRVAERIDASDADLYDLRGLAFGPSADPTDHSSVTSVYLLDAGGPGELGEIVEATTHTDLVPVAAVSPTAVRTVATSSYDPPSPDPSGIAYLPTSDRLFIADGEVDEMGIFQGANFFVTNRQGTLVTTGVSQPWSNEPVGVGYNPTNNHLFVSDDDQKQVFELVAGSDGRFGTGDDTLVTTWDTQSRGNNDPEGNDYDPVSGSLWTVDGVGAEVFRYRPGGDGRLGTSDDVVTQFDVGQYGARDPEGLGYDSVRDTIVIVDDSSATIYELAKDGSLLNTIDISSAGMDAAAGLAVAPASNGSGQRTYYVVARGLDNDSHPTENDGRLYEVTASLPPLGGGPVNQPPSVNAGADLSVTLPASVNLDGTVSDDGLPNPPGTLTTSWTQTSGPGVVTFGNPSAVDTTASFSSAGTYVLRLTANDSQSTTADEVTVFVAPVGGANTIERRIATSSDDAEQAASGFVALDSSDLELTVDGSSSQVVGLRFPGLAIPRGASIVSAYVQFTVDEVSTGAASITMRAENLDNTNTYTGANGNVTARPTTSASVAWSPPDWTTVGQAGAAQRTADVSSLIAAVVNRTGWSAGNALALQLTGTGRRTAEAVDGSAAAAPLLHVEYTTGGATNQPPVVDAGPDRSVTLPGSASLDGTVSDDGLPDPPAAVTTTWSEDSGPGTVTFGSAASVDTTASFSEAGTYVLRLTASDGALQGSDTMTVTVSGTTPTNQPPVVDAGPDRSVTLPGSASLDGTVSDDGLPDPPAAVTTTWSEDSGPGTVTFGSAASVDTTASFSEAGTYVLRLTASDGALQGSDTMTVTVSGGTGGGGTQTVERRVSIGSDDAEQSIRSGKTSISSGDLELTTDGNTVQVVGVRFGNLTVPQGATVSNAYVQFATDDQVSSGAIALTIHAEDVDNTVTYAATANDVTARATTSASVEWSPPEWSVVNEAGAAQRTPNLAALVQEVVDRAGWSSGNAFAIQVSGTGVRRARAFESATALAPLLHVEYSTDGSGGPVNQPPSVSAGPDTTVTLPAAAGLDGTVTDDGLVRPFTVTWSRFSGPGTVTFADAAAQDTTATFSDPGTYVLRLTADDGEHVVSDDVTVIATTGGVGGTQTLERRVAVGSDDAEQSLRTGATGLTSTDLEMTFDGATQQVVGVRFTGVGIPQGATVTNAYLQFVTDEVSTGASALTIRADDLDNTSTYAALTNDITGRPSTTASVAWSPPDWLTVGEAGAAQRTPDLSALVQEVVDRVGWASGNALAFQISGTGTRKARSFESGASLAPQLHIEYTTP